jgi:hypothetical protein
MKSKPTKFRKVREAAARLVLVVVGVVMALGMLELFARWRLGRPGSFQGGVVDLKDAGFRYGRHSFEKDPMVFRVVGIGDSFAFGVVQPSYNYHHIIQKRLVSELGRPVEVINLGKPSIGPAKGLAILRELGLKFSPDVVMWTFFVGNDFTDDPPGVEYSINDILSRKHWERAFHPHERIAWYERFRLYGYARFLWLRFGNVGVQGVDREGRMVLAPNRFLQIEENRAAVLMSDNRLRDAFHQCVKPRLVQAVSLCQKRGIPFVLVVAPDRVELEPDLARSVLESLGRNDQIPSEDLPGYESSLVNGDMLPLTIAHDLTAQFATLKGVHVVDLVEVFRQENDVLYLERNTHWNRAGNALAGETIASELARLFPH